MRLIREILNLLLGYRYRAVVLKDRGVERYWICSYIFDDTPAGNKALHEYINRLEADVRTFMFYEVISFRSRNEYAGILKQKINCMPALKDVRSGTEDLRRYADNK